MYEYLVPMNRFSVTYILITLCYAYRAAVAAPLPGVMGLTTKHTTGGEAAIIQLLGRPPARLHLADWSHYYGSLLRHTHAFEVQ